MMRVGHVGSEVRKRTLVDAAKRCCKAVWLVPLILSGGCLSSGPTNPSFAVSPDEAQEMLREMARHPRPLDRPLLIVSNYMDSGRHAQRLRHVFHDCTGDSRIMTVVTGFPGSLEECRAKIIATVLQAYPDSDATWTTEVDVVGVSLGGLAARYAAAPSVEAGGRRLHVARMFTIASPHRGAVIAKSYLANSPRLWRELRPSSDLLTRLAEDGRDADYELYPYARLRDTIVGEQNAAPPGHTPIWVSPPPMRDGHDNAWEDPRILADIARRLRDEPPLSSPPRAPLPQ